ncbi:hypothetical protein Mefer_0428 [Methanocaldococcus fervens AG86]|uniref:Uncharacterized protein n=1 Tax=Methanocaldococcus fervens (strain DSM 4213 / JCM 15782 / AG86) TaxID=573064 RepID=C7P6S2_METFA|nr:hypothetical protein Mefer_0428 [Methanocaldococcus fervens AG86]
MNGVKYPSTYKITKSINIKNAENILISNDCPVKIRPSRYGNRDCSFFDMSCYCRLKSDRLGMETRYKAKYRQYPES